MKHEVLPPSTRKSRENPRKEKSSAALLTAAPSTYWYGGSDQETPTAVAAVQSLLDGSGREPPPEKMGKWQASGNAAVGGLHTGEQRKVYIFRSEIARSLNLPASE